MRIGPFGVWEVLIILVIVLLVFGAKRLPEIGASLGKGIRTFKSSVTGEDEANSSGQADNRSDPAKSGSDVG